MPMARLRKARRLFVRIKHSSYLRWTRHLAIFAKRSYRVNYENWQRTGFSLLVGTFVALVSLTAYALLQASSLAARTVASHPLLIAMSAAALGLATVRAVMGWLQSDWYGSENLTRAEDAVLWIFAFGLLSFMLYLWVQHAWQVG